MLPVVPLVESPVSRKRVPDPDVAPVPEAAPVLMEKPPVAVSAVDASAVPKSNARPSSTLLKKKRSVPNGPLVLRRLMIAPPESPNDRNMSFVKFIFLTGRALVSVSMVISVTAEAVT